MIRAVVADDEPLIRDFLKARLEAAGDVAVVAECVDGDDAIDAIRSREPDVVFLDIQMPGRDGFGVIEAVGPAKMPLVVFVTAYDEYAIQAFEVHALDYLLKPFDADRVARAVERVRTTLADRDRTQLADRLERVLAAVGGDRERPHSLPVRIGERIELVRVADIDWVQAESNYVTLHAGPRALVIRETLGSLERKLDPRAFARVHRSYLVNLSRVKHLHPLFHGEYELVLTDGTRISTGRTYTHVVQRLARGLM